MIDAQDLTCDAFLDGRLQVLQPKKGFRAATDAVLVAAATPARPGDHVLDMGCGVGVISLCLAARVAALRLVGLEIQPEYAAFARRNAVKNGANLVVHEGDVAAPPDEIRQKTFDHVVSNPPFFSDASKTAPRDSGRQLAHLGTGLDLKTWVRACLRRVRPKGTITLIERTEAVPHILSVLAPSCGDISVLPIASRTKLAPGRVIISACNGTRGPFVLRPALVMHEGDRHTADGDHHTAAAAAVLRHGAALC